VTGSRHLAVVAEFAKCPAAHRGVPGDACERYAAPPGFATLVGWPVPAAGAPFQAELVIIGQGPLATASAARRHAIDPAADAAARIDHAERLSRERHDGARYFRLHILPLVREIFHSEDAKGSVIPWSRVFFTDAVFCPRGAAGTPSLETVAQCARLHLSRILAEPSVRVALCLGDEAVYAATSRYRWEPWRALHGRIVPREGGASLVLAVHPMGTREGGGKPWSRPLRGQLAAIVRAELSRAR
jgi:uracil-DNA glycosylase